MSTESPCKLNPPITVPYLAIEGNIGAGKTTLSSMIARDYGRRLILEQFDDNPFLPHFYREPERYAFPVELFFMTERHKQLQRELGQATLFEQGGVVSDYFFDKTTLFARNNLGDDEFRLFQRLHGALAGHFPPPDLLVYLFRPVEVLLEQIARRGREYETDIGADYLRGIQRAYLDYFQLRREGATLIINLEDADFVRDPTVYPQLLKRLSDSDTTGYQRVNWKTGAPESYPG